VTEPKSITGELVVGHSDVGLNGLKVVSACTSTVCKKALEFQWWDRNGVVDYCIYVKIIA